MTPYERNQVLVRAMELLDIVDCMVQTATVGESVYDIHNQIQNTKDDILDLTDIPTKGIV